MSAPHCHLMGTHGTRPALLKACLTKQPCSPESADSAPLSVSCQVAAHAGLPVRYILRSQSSDLYWQMQEEEQPNAQCSICFDLQAVLRSGKASWETKCKAARMLKDHQIEPYHDRVIYWSLRFASKTNNDVLTIVTDDMDHSKFGWPRFGFRKPGHDLDNIVRPTVTFTGALAHGFGTYLYMAGPQTIGVSDYFLGVLSRTLQYVFNQTSRPAGPPEDRQADQQKKLALPHYGGG